MTDFLRDAALLELRDDLVDEVSVNCAILSEKWDDRLAYLWSPIYILSGPICNILIFTGNVRVMNGMLA